MYALREVRVSWKKLLNSLGFDEQGEKQNKPKASTRKGSTSKSYAKLQEFSLITRKTRSSKKKLVDQLQELKYAPKSKTYYAPVNKSPKVR